MIKISVTVNGILFENPLILASGILDESIDSMINMRNSGAGGVVTKSTGKEERFGHPNPTFHVEEHGLMNAMGLPNPGAEKLREIIINSGIDFPVIASVFDSTPEGFVNVINTLDNEKIKAFELNLSCPHAKGYGADIGQEPDMVREFTKYVKNNTSKPVWVKLTPNVTDIKTIGIAAEEGGADAVVAINTIKGMSIDAYAEKPVLSSVYGGYSGPAIKPIGLRMVYELYEAIKIPIIGVGGITTGKDVIEYILAGASAVEIGSAIHYRGQNGFSLIKDEILEILKEKSCEDINALKGRAHGGET